MESNLARCQERLESVSWELVASIQFDPGALFHMVSWLSLV